MTNQCYFVADPSKIRVSIMRKNANCSGQDLYVVTVRAKGEGFRRTYVGVSPDINDAIYDAIRTAESENLDGIHTRFSETVEHPWGYVGILNRLHIKPAPSFLDQL